MIIGCEIYSIVGSCLRRYLVFHQLCRGTNICWSLSLDPISSKVKTGSTIIFSGQLSTTSGYIIPDATIFIKDDVSFGADTIIGTVVTDSNGEFYVEWVTQPRSSGSWNFYAVYEAAQTS